MPRDATMLLRPAVAEQLTSRTLKRCCRSGRACCSCVRSIASSACASESEAPSFRGPIIATAVPRLTCSRSRVSPVSGVQRSASSPKSAPRKLGLGNADDSRRLAVHNEGLSHDVVRPPEVVLPDVMRENDDQARAGLRLIGEKAPALHEANAECAEVVRQDDPRADGITAAVEGHRQGRKSRTPRAVARPESASAVEGPALALCRGTLLSKLLLNSVGTLEVLLNRRQSLRRPVDQRRLERLPAARTSRSGA